MLRIKELREQKRLNQGRLAVDLNVSQSTISAYEVGERTPDLEMLLALAKYFHVSLDYLVGQSDVKQNIGQSDLTQDEMEHLLEYRQLNRVDREKVKAYIDGLRSR